MTRDGELDVISGVSDGLSDSDGPSWKEVADALEGLVDDGTLSAKQAESVRDRLDSPPAPSGGTGDGEVSGDAGGGHRSDADEPVAECDPHELSWAAQFVRLSGLLLVVLLSIQFVDLNILNDPPAVDGAFLIQRWESPLWQLLDWLVIVLGAVHGAIGLRWIIHRRSSSPNVQLALEGLVYGLLAPLAALASYVVFAYG